MSSTITIPKGGRPRKLPLETAKRIAEQWYIIKAREPWLTQNEYAANYGISARCLRHYISEFGKEQQKTYWLKKMNHNEASKIEQQEEDTDPDSPATGLIACW